MDGLDAIVYLRVSIISFNPSSMRNVFFLLLITTFCMCKSKDVIPADQLTKYVVILEEKASPKVLKEVIPFDVVEANKEDEKKANIWYIDFKASKKDEGKLRTALLNHPRVLSAMSYEEYQKMKNKKTYEKTEGSMGKAGAERQ